MDTSVLNDFAYNVSCTANEMATETKDTVVKTVHIESRVNSLTQTQFRKNIADANEIVKSLYSKEGLSIIFEPSPINPLNIFWRLTVTIHCRISELVGSSQLSHRVLTLRQFDVLYWEIKHLSQLPSETPKKETSPLDDDLCSLCFDASATTILPCGHNFCRECVDKWFKAPLQLPRRNSNLRIFLGPNNRQQCPICRRLCLRNTEAWDLLNSPDALECQQEMSKVLRNLIFNVGVPPGPDAEKK